MNDSVALEHQDLPPFCMYDEEGVVLVDEEGNVILLLPSNVCLT